MVIVLKACLSQRPDPTRHRGGTRCRRHIWRRGDHRDDLCLARLGRLFYDSLSSRDYPVLMAMMEMSAVTIVFCNILADIIYGILDPRIRYS